MTQEPDPGATEHTLLAKLSARYGAMDFENLFSTLWVVASRSLIVVSVLLFIVFTSTNFEPSRLYNWYAGPSGAIYVSSPGVYTRERLVNDRNDQDFWLREQLDLLNENRSDFSYVYDVTRKIGVGEAERGNTTNTQEEENAPPRWGFPVDERDVAPSAKPENEVGIPTPTLSFADNFSLKAATRDAIRQSILENLLDDRHDLTGNSVYGLKFDTTVYPATFTSGRAFVKVSINIGKSDIIKKGKKIDEEYPELPAHVLDYYGKGFGNVASNQNGDYYDAFRLYSQWLNNVRWRLNSHFLQVVEVKCRCRRSDCTSEPVPWGDDVGSTVNTVLAMDEARLPDNGGIRNSLGSLASAETMALPDPWNNFLRISVKNARVQGCKIVPEFVVDPVTDSYRLWPGATTQSGYQQVASIAENESAFVFMPDGRDTNLNYALFWPHYPIHGITRYLRDKKLIQDCGIGDDGKPCRYIEVPAGYFNFIERVIEPDLYAYALFPRVDGRAALGTRTQEARLGHGINVADPTSRVEFRAEDNEKRASIQPSLVGFTDSKETESIDFGWVVEIPDIGAPFQKSQLALISVPAWSSELAVTITTGWLSATSEGVGLKPHDFTVPLPPDYEAFDAFIGGEEAVRRPKIIDEIMDAVTLVPCQRNTVLIPGLRLWRSAMVTVGSERADKITVLPNMRGIIAEFTRLSAGVVPGPATLRVWTSEGVDSIKGKATFVSPPQGNSCESEITSKDTIKNVTGKEPIAESMGEKQ